jgi:hypothetical protein
MKVILPEYEPILWGTSGRRLNDYALQMDYIKKRNIPLRLSKEFKLIELPSYVSSKDAMDAITGSNYMEFKKLVPNSVAAQFFNIQKELDIN